MIDNYINISGKEIAKHELTIEKASFFAKASTNNIYINLIKCVLCLDANECVIIDVEVERPQRVKRDIKWVERIAIIFDKDDKKLPEVLALREDFPEVPHINLRNEEKTKIFMFIC